MLLFERIFYSVVRAFFAVFFTLYNRLSVRWAEPLPRGGRVIVASNHCSNLDPILVGIAFPRRLRYFAKEELFRPILFGRIIRLLGAVPVSRADSASAASALKGFFRLLEEGNDVLIFPEGSRSPDGNLLPLEGGVGLIAVHSKADILPVFIRGSYDAMPPGAVLIKPRKITVTFGRRIVFDPELRGGKDAREKIMAELTRSLKALEQGEEQRRASCS
ncbi:MAG: 1-acyl-sn-glycerol-3-phosphate acyltransferase [Synergistaceae bacterium]|nr:1-acyl-sn-glycerol-3-phosphate acyltransferase [Synergistaceae bacterium]